MHEVAVTTVVVTIVETEDGTVANATATLNASDHEGYTVSSALRELTPEDLFALGEVLFPEGFEHETDGDISTEA